MSQKPFLDYKNTLQIIFFYNNVFVVSLNKAISVDFFVHQMVRFLLQELLREGFCNEDILGPI